MMMFQRLAMTCALLVSTRGFAAERPNVLFIAVDDLRCELACYGVTDVVSPNIDRLAAGGVRFDRAYCQQAVCNPSRVSVMTGLRPDTTQVWDLVTEFRTKIPDAITIPQHFRKHGYHAVSHGKIFHNPWPDQISWDEPHEWPQKGQLWSEQSISRLSEFRKQMRDLGTPPARIQRMRAPAIEIADLDDDSQHKDGAIADQALESLERLSSSKQPFFLATGFVRPHLPFVVPRKYWELYDRDAIDLAPNPFFPKNMPDIAFGRGPHGGLYELRDYLDYADVPSPFESSLTTAQQKELKHGYYAAVSFIDAQVGRLLDKLESLQLTDNTIVVLWSDHGWKLGEHNGWCKQTNFEIDTRVPLLIRAPSAKANGAATNSLAELVDIYPTLCELADLPVPDFLEGTSLVPVLNDVKVEVKDIAISQFPHQHEGRPWMGYAIRTDRFRYIEWIDVKNGEISDRELYDHLSDPDENENVVGSPEQSETVNLLHERLRRAITIPVTDRGAGF